ncbi:DUF6223 family protein [Saccharothrix xinjiangensis]|uniref:DUF6223 family protein n=1 Tax=Saccharothrix xinjiangensis TaxID=204798 RepID=A0ABV9Y785_9PSEU
MISDFLAVTASFEGLGHLAAQSRGMGAGRAVSLVAGLSGLVGAVVGGLAAARPGSGRGRAVVALVAGVVGGFLGVVVVVTAEGGPGTGNGVGGGVVAAVVGLVGAVLGGLALARSRRAADRSTGTRRGSA